MSGLKYLCHDCCALLSIESNEMAVNEAGRKFCEGCGWNKDTRLHVIDEEEVDRLLASYNRAQESNR